jgi:hypothetical protein
MSSALGKGTATCSPEALGRGKCEVVARSRRRYRLASWHYFSRPRLAVLDKTRTWHSAALTCDLQRGKVATQTSHGSFLDRVLEASVPLLSTHHARRCFSRSAPLTSHSPSLCPPTLSVPCRKKRRCCSLRGFIYRPNQHRDLHELTLTPQPTTPRDKSTCAFKT